MVLLVLDRVIGQDLLLKTGIPTARPLATSGDNLLSGVTIGGMIGTGLITKDTGKDPAVPTTEKDPTTVTFRCPRVLRTERVRKWITEKVKLWRKELGKVKEKASG
jgi:hypothetical protein